MGIEIFSKIFSGFSGLKSPPISSHQKVINSFDCDGVIFINEEVGGVHPGPNDVIITGRSVDEQIETYEMLQERGIYNLIYFNPLPFDKKTRKSSGYHKANILNELKKSGYIINCHFEDDEVQAEVIRKNCPDVTVVMLVHDLTNKENVRHRK